MDTELEKENLDLEDHDDNFEEVSEASRLNWFTLRVLRNEERCIAHIKEHIALKKLQEKIVDIKLFKEFVIEESGEFEPGSDFLPKVGFKSTKSTVWVRIPNGNYKKIKLVEKKPFSGMVFIKMEADPELFKAFRTWDTGYSFLGYPFPSPMSDAQLERTAQSLDTEIPDIYEYIKSKGYQIVEGARSKFKDLDEIHKRIAVEKDSEPVEDEAGLALEEVDTFAKEEQEDDIYGDLPQTDNNFYFPESKSNSKPAKVSKKKDDELKVNDFVFVKHLGFKGVIQEIDYSKDRVVVGVQMFSRRQPVECKISEVSLI